MKKLMTIVLALVLVLAMSVSAFASTVITVKDADGNLVAKVEQEEGPAQYELETGEYTLIATTQKHFSDHKDATWTGEGVTSNNDTYKTEKDDNGNEYWVTTADFAVEEAGTYTVGYSITMYNKNHSTTSTASEVIEVYEPTPVTYIPVGFDVATFDWNTLKAGKSTNTQLLINSIDLVLEGSDGNTKVLKDVEFKYTIGGYKDTTLSPAEQSRNFTIEYEFEGVTYTLEYKN